MSKMAQLCSDIEDLIEKGMSAKFICVTLGVPYDMVQDVIEQRECLELEKQHEMMSLADQMANDDSQYYGEE